MNSQKISTTLALCALLAMPTTSWADDVAELATAGDPAFEKIVKPFLLSHCAGCHGANKQKGERRFDTLASTIDGDDSFVDYQDILDQLNLGEMPPQEAKQPSPERRREVVVWLTRKIKQYHLKREALSGETVLRRLNSREYENTIRDLMHLEMSMFQPAANFPRERTTEHLDNIGATLVTSGYLLSKYLDAADLIVQKSLYPREKPAVQKWTFRDEFKQQPEIDQVHRKTHGHSHLTLYEVIAADRPEGAYASIHAFEEGVPFDGFYEIRFKAKALNREHPYDPKLLGTDPREPLRLGIVAGNYLAGDLHKQQAIEPLLTELDLSDGEDSYSVRVWLDAGYTPRFTFRNGTMDVRSLWGRLISKYPDQFPKLERGIVAARFTAIKYGKIPQIHIDDIEIQGPFFDQWPKQSQKLLLGDDCEQILATGKMSPRANASWNRVVLSTGIPSSRHVVGSRACRCGGRSATESRTEFVGRLFRWFEDRSLFSQFLVSRGGKGRPAFSARIGISTFILSLVIDARSTIVRFGDREQTPGSRDFGCRSRTLVKWPEVEKFREGLFG